MPFQLTHKYKGRVIHNAFARAITGFRDQAIKKHSIIVLIYFSREAFEENESNYIDSETINVDPKDFDKYLSNTALKENNTTFEKAIYTFLSTIDPDEEGTRYPSCRFDFKHDTVKV